MRYFSLVNDPDHGKTENYREVLTKLSKKEIFITTAVFCKLKDNNSALSKHCNKGDTDTLSDPHYKKLMLEARDLGHEIAFHGYSQVSDTSDEFQEGLDNFKKIFGDYPKIYIEHGGHLKSHNKDMVKKENLSFYGSNSNSKYYIKDKLKNIFDLIWTHDYLMDDLKSPLPVKKIFETIDGITYFKRWRMYHFNDLKKKIDNKNNVIVGYTHFGYEGYKRSGRNFLLNILNNQLNKKSFLERWQHQDIDRSIRILSDYLIDYKVKPLTISNLYNIYLNQHQN
jgi:hypothetical protein